MKICIICEGSYPYITGGVSSWVHSLMNNLPEYEFIIYTIGAQEKDRGVFKYKLPNNVISVHEVFLDSFISGETQKMLKSVNIDLESRDSFKRLILGSEVDWTSLFNFIRNLKVNNVTDFFMSMEFFEIIKEICTTKFDYLPFTEFFWTMRSMLLPLLNLIRVDIPQADIYHSVSAGYGGIIGSLGTYLYNKPYILTEHGIYSREREEEIIKSSWVTGYLKDEWINFFYNLSRCSYDMAEKVVTLFERNRGIEIELGCSSNKIQIIANGIELQQFKDIQTVPANTGFINIGAVVRVVPIKDIKTMIHAFSLVKSEMKNTKLHIIGPIDEDKEYYSECRKLVEFLEVKDVVFTGTVNIKDYIGDMDMLLLSSISEGQPLAVLEGMACSKPFITTDVGSCRELIYGSRNDGFGQAGIVVPIMDCEKMAEAILTLCKAEKLRINMGRNGYQRVKSIYTLDKFISGYRKLYEELGGRT